MWSLFALRSGKEHRDLKFDQITIEATASGKKGTSNTPKMHLKIWFVLIHTNIMHVRMEPHITLMIHCLPFIMVTKL